jgi:hypothetical protein
MVDKSSVGKHRTLATQSAARNWITLESTSYFVLREIESMIKRPETAAKPIDG